MKDKISRKLIRPGDSLPSINEISSRFQVARETAVKAYKSLRQEGLVDSVPGKGFFLISDRISDAPRVMMVLNTYNSYMQTLYHAYMGETGLKATTDIYFHNNNMDIFRNLITAYSSRYTHHIIKPPFHKDVSSLLEGMDQSRLLLLDRDEYKERVQNYICQDFSRGFSGILRRIIPEIRKYEGLYLIRSQSNPHPQATFEAFTDFLREERIEGAILSGTGESGESPGKGYIVNSDEDMVRLLQIFKAKGWIPGKDGGIIVYNETPILEFIGQGVSSISVDFREMGRLAARFILDNGESKVTMNPRFNSRESF